VGSAESIPEEIAPEEIDVCVGSGVGNEQPMALEALEADDEIVENHKDADEPEELVSKQQEEASPIEKQQGSLF